MQGGEMNTMKKCSACGSLYAGDLCPKCMAGFAQKPTEPTAAPDELPLRTGQIFHGLEILELLGKGGMGIVYKARQPALDRTVALKILPQRMALDPDFQGRFIREAKALGSLNHPNIVAVYDFGAEGGLFFFAMEYVDGTNLRQILRNQKLLPAQALKIVPQLCDALEYAHSEGVVHRDIKPENILIDKKGRVKIADFGLAKLVGSDAPAMLTVTNMVMGTPHYMAPEQVENPKGVDHRADIYAIGVVFYEMLTGELPIGRFELPSKKVQIDVRLDDVVLKALEKSPDRRYQNAGDVKVAVTKATTLSSVESYSPTVLTPRPARKSRAPLGLGMLAALAVLVLGYFTWHRSDANLPLPAGSPGRVPGPNVPIPTVASTEPEAKAPIDLAQLYFGPDERPGGYVYQGIGTGLPRNPMPASSPAELEVLIKILDDIGLTNIGAGDLQQGYVAAWFRWEAAFVALESRIAKRIEQEFGALHKIHNRWSYRRGPLLVMAWSPRKELRPVFVDLVTRLQKKLGLALEAPEIPLENLKLDRSDLPRDWIFRDEGPSTAPVAGLSDRYEASMESSDSPDRMELRIWVGKSAGDADAFAARNLGLAGFRKTELRRTGRTVTALGLRGEDIGAFEKVACQLRRLMGFPERTFETIALAAEDVPEGFSLDRSETDPAKVLESLGITGVLLSEVAHAALYRLKPAGRIALVELHERQARSLIEEELRKTGVAWSSESWVFGVEGPDDGILDALENRMREKLGWDRQNQRYVTIPTARLKTADLPAGYALLGDPKESEQPNLRLYEAQIKGPQGTYPLVIQVADQSPAYQNSKRFPGARPDDVLLTKDTDYVAARIASSGEGDWASLDVLEEMLRKKLRLRPRRAEDYSIESFLPKDCSLADRYDPGFPQNPRVFRSPTAVRQGLGEVWAADLSGIDRAWGAVVSPGDVQVFFFQLGEGMRSTEITPRLRKASATNKHLSIREKGSIVAVVRDDQSDNRVFKLLDEVVRMRLRQK